MKNENIEPQSSQRPQRKIYLTTKYTKYTKNLLFYPTF